jgi:UDP-GlcNAc:undecaprenyl-phosphate/decaprenyl-phosphate GlcNAc-1-phosphate transferase
VYTTRFVGFSRTVFVLDWVFLFILISGTRVSFRVFAEMLRPARPSFRRVLIYGAGAGGELILRELLNNPELQRIPVGFVDDDRSTHGSRIHGVAVLGSSEDLGRLLTRHGVAEVIVSSPKIQGGTVEQLTEVCRLEGVAVRRASIRLE